MSDLDSARSEVLSCYKSMGTEVTFVAASQDNDLEKSLDLVDELRGKGRLEGSGAVKGGRLWKLGGGLTEIAGATHSFTHTRTNSRASLASGGEAIASEGGKHLEHRIRMVQAKRDQAAPYLPLGSPVVSADSTGLKWNLTNH